MASNHNKIFYLNIEEISPSQLYLSEQKLAELKDFIPSEKEALPVRKFGNKIALTDGHHRAYLFYRSGVKKLPVYWDCEDLDWSIYDICLGWCYDEHVHQISDFSKRILTAEDYQKLWHDRCEELYN